jgi:hypothetical protein
VTTRTRTARSSRSRPEGAPGGGALPRRADAGSLWLEVLLLGAITLAVRLVYLNHAPYIDELYHALAARSLLQDGTLLINGEVPYTRGWGLTYAVAGLFWFFGESLVVGRIPAVVAGVGLVIALFVWLRSVAAVSAAWIAAILLCFAPISIYLSQQVRFYTLHALFFWLGAFAVYAASTPAPGRTRRKAWLAAGAVACFVVAFHLQPITAIGVAALALWLALRHGPELVRWVGAGGRKRALLATGVLLAAGALLVTAGAGGLVSRGLAMMANADMWAAGAADNYWFYFRNLGGQYATLWTLFPLGVLIAASRFRTPALFLTTIFVAAFVFHSVAAWKHERYLFYVLPAFFGVWGLAAAVALPWLRQRFDALLSGVMHLPRPAATAAFVAVLGVATLWAAVGNTATLFTYRMLTTSDAEWRLSRAYRGEADWQAALPILRAEAEASDIIVASSMLKALYFLGRLDVGLSLNEMLRGVDRSEFSVASMEGAPVISSAASVATLHGCVASGLVIADQRNWRTAWGVPPATADYIDATFERLPVPEALGVLAFRWRDGATAQSPACQAVTRLVARGNR